MHRAYRADPITCPLDDVPGPRPALLIVGGHVVHDPEERLSARMAREDAATAAVAAFTHESEHS
jgi:hypothetical protein